MMSKTPSELGHKISSGVALDVLEHLLSFYVCAVSYRLSRDLDRRMDGLEVAQGAGKITTLLLIDSHPGIRPSAIAVATLRDRPSISRIVAPLVEAGLVERRIATHERRASELFITPQGHEVAARVRRIAGDQSEAFFTVLPKQDQDQLMRILRDIYMMMRVEP